MCTKQTSHFHEVRRHVLTSPYSAGLQCCSRAVIIQLGAGDNHELSSHGVASQPVPFLKYSSETFCWVLWGKWWLGCNKWADSTPDELLPTHGAADPHCAAAGSHQGTLINHKRNKIGKILCSITFVLFSKTNPLDIYNLDGHCV